MTDMKDVKHPRSYSFDSTTNDSGVPVVSENREVLSHDLIRSAGDILVGTKEDVDYEDSSDAFDRFLRNVVSVKDVREKQVIYDALSLPDIDRIPNDVWRLYGCNGCEWKGTNRCYHKTSPEMIGRINLCGKRKLYLWYMTRDMELIGTKKKYSMSQWNEAFMKNRMIMDLNNRYRELDRSMARLEELETEILQSFGKDTRTEWNEVGNVTSTDIQQLEYLEGRRKELQKEYDDLMKFVLKTEQLEIERDTPKQLDVNIRNSFSIMDMQRIINMDSSKIKDSDYDVIDVEDIKNKEGK